MPQPQIDLIDAETGKIIEVIHSPQAFVLSTCFSPDGNTLATSGCGEVLLWDTRGL